MKPLSGTVALFALMLAACGSQSQTANAESRLASSDMTNAGTSIAEEHSLAAGNDAAPAKGGYTEDASNAPLVGVLRDIFIRAGTIDGKPIKDFRLVTSCQTAFVTDSDTITIDWSHVGNYAGRLGGGRETFPIDDGKGTHNIAVPSGQHPEPLGNSGARVDSGLGSLADSCAH